MTKTNSKLSKIMQTWSAKILASFLILVVLISSFAISSFAEVVVGYAPIDPIYIYDFGGEVTVTAFPGPHTESVYYQSDGSFTTFKTYLDNNDYFNEYNTRLKIKSINGSDYVYFQIVVKCNYDRILVNEASFSGYTTSSQALASPYNLFNPSNFYCTKGSGSSLTDTDYYYYFDMIISNNSEIEQARQDGYNQGYATGLEEGYEFGSSSYVVEQARQQGYNEGVADGRTMTDSQNLGANLLGDTLNAPIKALNDFVIYESTNGFEVTLGLVVGCAISLTLFIAFLKIFAGG